MNFNSLPKPNSADEFIVQKLDGNSYSSSFLNSLVVPRPIAFVTTVSGCGIVNAAPFSYFNVVCTHPPIVSIAIEKREGTKKDTSKNILISKEFVINICSVEMAKAVTIASNDFPPEISEIELLGLSLLPSQKISVPRIANTFAQLECELNQVIEVGNDPTDLILANVVNVHMHKSLINSHGRIDTKKLDPLARLSGGTYAKVADFFEVSKDWSIHK